MTQANKLIVKINGVEYTIVSSEDYEYIQKIAMFVDRKMTAISNANTRLSTSMVAVLSAVNIADNYFKIVNDADNMRTQLLEYVDELSKKSTEIEELSRENNIQKSEIQRLQIEIAKKEGHNNR